MDTFDENTSKLILQNIKNWTFKNNEIERQFVFKDFSTAIAFVVQVGFLAEKSKHHPDIFISYNKVDIRLTTHDFGGVTEKDFGLAKLINTIDFKI
jgi:4a-hydroxytetrahydrobiopterin dehydratase